ncbi:expansin-B15-like [Tasmannia lanceolata]|uniref:expansin-B15-like n=1 Tax=Tasmannia lanceolata TaxID=3420 RepID=UPI0040632E3F
MALFSPFLALLVLSSLLNSCFGFKSTQLNISTVQSNWSPATATWYGSPNGDGSEGGACGYGRAVGQTPYYSMVSAGGPSLFSAGKGCGACYQVKCTSNSACSRNPVTVVITDECPGGPCLSESVHFDLSGTAFGRMAISSRDDRLRNVGILPIQYRRVACNYGGMNIAFHVDSGSNPYYFAVVVEFENGEGEVAGIGLQQPSDQSSNSWLPMQESWGAVWKLNYGSVLKAPFSLKLISPSGKTLVAHNVIPARWLPGITYRSLVNFH